MSEMALELRDVSQHFEQGGAKISILKGANLSLEKGKMTALIGPSGAGKTTLLNIAGMLEDAASGEVPSLTGEQQNQQDQQNQEGQDQEDSAGDDNNAESEDAQAAEESQPSSN